MQQSNRFKYGTQSILTVILILAILGIINFISTRFFVRADLTEDNIYTISDASKKRR